jgi:TorA maturation chaperone TorD
MSVPTSIRTAFERARRYQELSREFLQATEEDPTLMPACPPYETQYGAPHVFAQSEELADVGAFYRACGLASPAKERLDHVSVELEFMSFLALKEAYARFQGEEARVGETRELQAKFLADHLGRWAPAFLARFEPRWPDLSGRLRDWIGRECEALGARPAALRAIDVRQASGPDEPFDCGGGTCPAA